jgi:AmiR/NasT family two-component response regulator
MGEDDAQAPRASRALRRRLVAVRLQRAMASRATIEQAKGIIIARTGCEPDQAFEVLVSESQHENRKLRDVAADLVRRNVRSRDAT